jgi:hypothetical protein
MGGHESMNEQFHKDVNKVVTQTVRATGRVAFEAGIKAIQDLENQTPKTQPSPPYAGGYFAAGYKQGLADAKAKLHELLAIVAE